MKHGSASGKQNSPLRQLPSVNRILQTPAVADLASRIPRTVVTDAINQVLDSLRAEMSLPAESRAMPVPSDTELSDRVVREATNRMAPTLQAAVNATGIVLHTGL